MMTTTENPVGTDPDVRPYLDHLDRRTGLPDEVVALLNDPASGRQAVQLLHTVDDLDYLHAILSCARQWWTGDGRLVCVFTAGRTTGYLLVSG